MAHQDYITEVITVLSAVGGASFYKTKKDGEEVQTVVPSLATVVY
jgi:hypothetical protein